MKRKKIVVWVMIACILIQCASQMIPLTQNKSESENAINTTLETPNSNIVTNKDFGFYNLNPGVTILINYTTMYKVSNENPTELHIELSTITETLHVSISWFGIDIIETDFYVADYEYKYVLDIQWSYLRINYLTPVKTELYNWATNDILWTQTLNVGQHEFARPLHLTDYAIKLVYKSDVTPEATYVYSFEDEYDYYYYYQTLNPIESNIRIYDSDGIGRDINEFVIYVNASRIYDGIFNTFDFPVTLYYNITVFDYLGCEVYKNTQVATKNIDIFIPTVTLNVFINSSQQGFVRIKREGLAFELRVAVNSLDSLQYRFLVNQTYEISYELLNGTIYQSTTIDLIENHTLNFGYWTIQSTLTLAPESPLPEINYSALIFIFALYAILIVIAALPQKSKNKIPKFRF